MDVTEMFSPPRVTKRAEEYWLRAGFVVDLTTERRPGEFWELSRDDHVAALEKFIRREKSWLLAAWPPCTDHCELLHLTYTKEEILERQRARGEKHLNHAMRFCAMQARGER